MTDDQRMETEANRFAMELLMPWDWLVADIEAMKLDVENDEQVAKLAKRYGVSVQVMTLRIGEILRDKGVL